MLAYLVIREDSKWTDVFRLVPGETVTVGRATTNRIVVKDERCSRNHAEIFLTQGRWTLRDLDSRNGTTLGGTQIRGDVPLTPGDVIRIAHCQMAFVDDVSKAFREPYPEFDKEDGTVEGQSIVVSDSNVLEDAHEPTHITHRRQQTKFLKAQDNDSSLPKVGRAAAALFRLAFQLANLAYQGNLESVCRRALDALFEGTVVDAGAVLLGPHGAENNGDESLLQTITTRADTGKYHRISGFLAATVMTEGEAVLARNIEDDSMLGVRDSKGVIRSTSVICAPIRLDRRVIGLVHLYSTDADRVCDPDDLEFTLAVADNLASSLKIVHNTLELSEDLSAKNTEVEELRTRLGAESEIVAVSPVMERVQQQIARAAPSRATVLIRGESGVGKELVARATHFASERKSGPFVCLNCAALSESLLESELFGHEKGAFTGATDRKKGKFETADSGTLMLDEIGEMSSSIQAKFLRVLEGHPFERLGGNKPIKVDVRVIAATNRNLEKAVEEKSFRRDLYFRLQVLEIYVPPLRKRPEDVIVIARHFLERFKTETGRKIVDFSDPAANMLTGYHWPGNVRELRNVIERAVVLARGTYIEVEDLALSNLTSASETGEIKLSKLTEFEPLSLEEIEKQHIVATLNFTKWNKSKAAQALGIERSTLDRKIKRYGLKPDG